MVMHPEMYEDGNPVDPAELIYLRIHEEDDILNDEDE